ncbi:MAG: RluA family pseudouridine synthase [Oscillospiraceae bacterium]|nr:RluA family pseudouridine synthase [Oscillospiraceae bacterium]
MILSYTVPDGPDRKVHTILRRELKASAALVRRLKLCNAIFANGEPVFTDRMLKPGDVLTADISAAEEPCDVVPEKGELHIIYEDEGMLVVNKPCGILVHPSRARYTGTLSNFAAGYLLEKEGSGVVHAVNRLDRDTGGVVVFAKNSYMKAILSDALEETGEKKYFAVVHGKMPEENGMIDAPIKRLAEGDMMRCVSPDGQRAVTHYKTIGEYEAADETISMLYITLETGRTHQIRVHCTHMGCPLLGDCLYYTDASRVLSEKLEVSAQLLHAVMLIFCHPLTGEELVLNAPVLREDMKRVLELFD